QVEHVTLWRRGVRCEGTLHLTAHHIIFSYVPPDAAAAAAGGKPAGDAKPLRPKETWITYPMISFCTYRPAPPASRQSPSIRIRCRDFVFVAFHFQDEFSARDAYDSIRSLTCKLGRIERLYAFSYRPQSPEKDVNGWEVYDARQEFKRMGISAKDVDRGWRISNINSTYQYSPTYPSVLAVPTSISDNTLKYAAAYRSRARIPVLTYLHPVNNCSIARSSQPLVGVRNNRNVQDERLVSAIFSTSKPDAESLSSSASTIDLGTTTPNRSSVHLPAGTSGESSFVDAEALEDAATRASNEDAGSKTPPKIYGAQQENMIVDARPMINAYAMQAAGLGSENMENYKSVTKAFLNIDNIHVMRDSLNKVVEALKDTDVTPLPPNRELLVKSGWLKHIKLLLEGSTLIAQQVGIRHSHVLIHCSDGWDRTSQLSALSQLCLDPYYRTLEGFIVLIEKDWLSFGHMFRNRSGHLNSDKWFEVENERVGGGERSSGAGGKALENAFLSAKGFFNRKNDSRESLVDSEPELQATSDQSPATGRASTSNSDVDVTVVTKPKETSPVFHQFLDATYQMMYQFPTRFEFNERFLRRLLYHLYSCQYGTFLYDNEKQRVEADVRRRTRSVWDYFLARKQQFINESYDPVIDDNVRGKERLLFPDAKKVRWWAEVFGRQDSEMNIPASSTATGVPNRSDTSSPLVAALQNGTNTIHSSSRPRSPFPPSAVAAPGGGRAPPAPGVAAAGAARAAAGSGITAGMASMSLGWGLGGTGVGAGARSSPKSRSRSPRVKKGEAAGVEVEMQ
ncbi:protein-tyrosine phosphatase-like protein, partial [Lineolata rhizophorae]